MLDGEEVGGWTVSVAIGDEVQGSFTVDIGKLSDGGSTDFYFPLANLEASRTPYTLRCTAVSATNRTTLSHSSVFRYLPLNPVSQGSTIKMDAKNGRILVPSKTGNEEWEPFFPLGFYAGFGGYLEKDLGVLDELKAKGVNIVHPVPPFHNLTALENLLDKLEELELWLMYDMRWVRPSSSINFAIPGLDYPDVEDWVTSQSANLQSYMNSTSVQEQVEAVKRRPNLLLWYTADEPDGPGDPLDATVKAYDQIMDLDGYHPISLVLNCEDFEWKSYVAGADIVLSDPYPLYVNTAYSDRYHTICDSTYGCCVCDNCLGNLTDVAGRLDASSLRAHVSGRHRNLTTWAVLQAFGSSEFWTGTPNEDEYAAMSVVALNHGATGMVSWVLPTTPQILLWTHKLSLALPNITKFLFSPTVEFIVPTSNSTAVDIGLWTDGDSSLLLVASMAPSPLGMFEIPLPFRPKASREVLESHHSGCVLNPDAGVVLIDFPKAYGVVGVILEQNLRPTSGAGEAHRQPEQYVAQVPFIGLL